MSHYTSEEKLLLIQHCIYKYDSEEMLKTKLRGYFTPKEIESAIDTLIAKQQIRRIGQDMEKLCVITYLDQFCNLIIP